MTDTGSSDAIAIRDLRKRFTVGFGGLRTVDALRGVDLTVRRGEIYGFLGPNGAGKSTTIKILTRLIRATGGEAEILGEPLGRAMGHGRIGYLPEQPVFYDYLTGAEFLRYYGVLAGLSRAEATRRAEALLERVGLASAGDLQLRRYSKGMTQRVGIAQALLGDPDVVILDEPMSGLDPIGRREIRELMMDLKSEGKTVFFSTHIIPDVELTCDRVGILIGGRVVKEGSVGELVAGRQAQTEIHLSGIDAERAAALCQGAAVREMGDRIAMLIPGDASIDAALRAALEAGASVRSVQPQRQPLEELFIGEIEAREGREDAPRAGLGRKAS